MSSHPWVISPMLTARAVFCHSSFSHPQNEKIAATHIQALHKSVNILNKEIFCLLDCFFFLSLFIQERGGDCVKCHSKCSNCVDFGAALKLFISSYVWVSQDPNTQSDLFLIILMFWLNVLWGGNFVHLLW